MTTFFLILAFFVSFVNSEVDTSKWQGRSIYFIVTDRFAQNEAAQDSETTCDGIEWCGGTLKGVVRKLDYIQGMGFDAIWITPVVKQVDWRDNYNGTAYHGYWAADFFEIDPHLGTEQDLLALKQECQKRGMLLMLDVVANHVGPIHGVNQIQKLGSGLNSIVGKQFHQLGRGPEQSLASYIKKPATMMEAGPRCWPNYDFGDGCNYSVILDGWFGDLADLRQENPETRLYLLTWIQFLVRKYGVDGLRLDTALYIPKWFLQIFQEAAGVYMIGEVVTYNISVHRSFVPPLTGLLNFPIAEHLNTIFSINGSMIDLQKLTSESAAASYPNVHLLGNFVDNHDSDRFLYNHSGDLSQLKNALTWTLLYHGLPIVYYGTEQEEVSNQKDARTSMWPHFSQSALYTFLKDLNQLRRDSGLSAGGEHVTSEATVLFTSDRCMLMSRAELLVLLTNGGTGGKSCQVCLPLSSLPPVWSDTCQQKPRVLLPPAPEPYCRKSTKQLCISTSSGFPSVVAPAVKLSAERSIYM